VLLAQKGSAVLQAVCENRFKDAKQSAIK
jgi:hypothetical protein